MDDEGKDDRFILLRFGHDGKCECHILGSHILRHAFLVFQCSELHPDLGGILGQCYVCFDLALGDNEDESIDVAHRNEGKNTEEKTQEDE